MVAVGAWVRENVHTIVTDLDGKRVRVGVSGDGKEAVRAAVASAPDLREFGSAVRRMVSPASREPPRPGALGGPDRRPFTAG